MAEKGNQMHARQAFGRGGMGGGPGGRFQNMVEKPGNSKEAFFRLVKYLTSSKGLVIFLIIIVIIFTLANLYTNILVKDIVASFGIFNTKTKEWQIVPDEAKFTFAITMLIIFYVTHCVLQYLSSFLGAYLAAKTVKKMRNDLFKKIAYLPISYLDSHLHGDLLSRMTNDIDNISQAISSSITSLTSGVLMIIGCIGIMLWYSPLLTLVSLVSILLTFLLAKFMNKFARPLFIKQQRVLGKLNAQTEEMVTGNKTVITNNREGRAIEEFNEFSNQFTHAAIRAQILGGAMGPVMNFINNLGYFLVCLFGAVCILNGIGNTLLGDPLEVSIVIMFLTTSKQFARPINEIAQLYSSLITALAGAERVFAVMDEDVESFAGNISMPENEVVGNIEFSHVRFGYDPEIPVLKDFSAVIPAGHKIALVGETGSGKTTIVNLLLRYYDINSGFIKIDGKDILNVSKKELRDSISIVLQDPVLFCDTIENNIRYGKSDATDEEIDFALELANCKQFVDLLPDGKKTMLVEGATNISQGQRQLLTIARAILADPKILILDEATSSVDTRTEKKIQDAMIKLMENRTSIIIAHRLSTIQDSNKIIVLDSGMVVEEGNHRELLDKNGVYKKLYETQFKGLST